MAAVMAAGMTPPLGLALATVLRKKLFTHVERENGKAAWVLGASFITEGAIPFAAGDPLRVIPSLMAGSAVTGGLSMAFGCTSRAPHGGIFVVPLIGNPFLYLLAIIIGTVVTAFLVVTLKSFHRTPEEAADETPATAGCRGRLIVLRISSTRVGRRTGGPPAPSSKGVPVPERKVKVGSSVGLHARPATIFTQAAAKQPVKVTIAKAGGNAVDARSVLFVLGLDVRGGDEVVLAAEGEGAEAALDELEALLQRDLDKE